MTTILYAVIAIVFLLLVLTRFGRTPHHADDESPTYPGPSVGNGRWLHLSERIFDASDARWLAEELAFPKLARDLTRERKRLAIHWLQALQAAFDQVVRTPELSTDEVPEANADGWHTLWLAVRFKLLIYYALIVVRVFGPYHRLIPSFAWVPRYREGEQSLGRVA
jgi:hypothetical protein